MICSQYVSVRSVLQGLTAACVDVVGCRKLKHWRSQEKPLGYVKLGRKGEREWHNSFLFLCPADNAVGKKQVSPWRPLVWCSVWPSLGFSGLSCTPGILTMLPQHVCATPPTCGTKPAQRAFPQLALHQEGILINLLLSLPLYPSSSIY